MRYCIISVFLFFSVSLAAHNPAGIIIVKSGVENNRLSAAWKEAITSRMPKAKLDSMAKLERPLTPAEKEWGLLIREKKTMWNGFRDSLAVPFTAIRLPDTIFVLLGGFGVDDGFTYKNQTVCLDLTALQKEYGDAALPENQSRIDRIFAHEYTHLLHKEWARLHKYSPVTFKDSILWECLYEGIGMYRSLNKKWMPVNNVLPIVTKEALANLTPVFSEKIKTVLTRQFLSGSEKESIQKNLSRGQVNQKWGAFPVAIWLLLEAGGDEKNLIKWIEKGPMAVLELAKKFLPGKESLALSQQKTELIFATYTYSTNNRLQNITPLAEWLSAKTGQVIKAVSYPTVESLISAIKNDSVQIAMMNTSGYLVLQRNYPGLVSPHVNLELNSSKPVTNYAGCVIASKATGLKTLKELSHLQSGTQLALVNSSSTSGNLVPRLLLNEAGVAKAENKFRVYYTGTHKGVVDDVLNGKAMLGGCGCAEIDSARARKNFDDKAIVLAMFDDIPLGPIVMNNKMSHTVIDQVKQALLQVGQEDPGLFRNFCNGWTEFKEASNFKPVQDTEYNKLRSMFGDNKSLWSMIE